MLEKVREEIIKFNQDRDWDQFHSPENEIDQVNY